MRLSGGSGIGLLIVLGIMWLVFGINPLALLQGGGISPTPQNPQVAPSGGGVQSTQSEMDDFVATVLADTEDVWSEIFRQAGRDYPEPTLVLFSGSVSSACGYASSASGPFYCPGDRKLYIDLSFYEQLRRRFNAPGDFAQAYVLAHEVGHHVQNVVGLLPKFNEERRRMSERQANQYSVRVELQADCYAGVWANKTAHKGYLEEGDIDEALNAAAQIGDDMIQKRTQGYVVPDAFNHGTSEQRRRWFYQGYKSGNTSDCDTFNIAEP
jgi:predicted metalloprotease